VADGLEFLPGSQEERAGMLLALCGYRLEDLAAPDAPAVISEAVGRETEIYRDAAKHPPGTKYPTPDQRRHPGRKADA
jgi:hypothetical protein